MDCLRVSHAFFHDMAQGYLLNKQRAAFLYLSYKIIKGVKKIEIDATLVATL